MKFTIKEIRFKDYKSFKGDYISLKPEKITLLIGRNNCGKSSIIDVFESITSPSFFHKHRCSILIDINGQKVRNEPFSGYKEYIGDKTIMAPPAKALLMDWLKSVHDYQGDRIAFLRQLVLIFRRKMQLLLPLLPLLMISNKEERMI